jgi:lipopolysaccharide transport system ATP-binding protein
MPEVAISVEGIGKRYRLGRPQQQYGRLTESLSGALRSIVRRERSGADLRDFWALSDISFEVREGDVLGIIGRNGAGKSTLLRILSRITEPTTGYATLHGRVGSLLEVGTGFHPELNGRENVFLSGAILGMRRSDIARRFDEIVAFADVDRFLDTPVKRYSSGMKVRLGFAVAAFLEPEILVVDEVLSVGDAEFQRKCLARMEGVAHEGRTVLFVSHNMSAVETLCRSALMLEGGRITDSGLPHDVIGRYLEKVMLTENVSIEDRLDRDGNGRARILGIEASARTGAWSQLRFHYRVDPDVRHVEVEIGVYALNSDSVCWLSSELAATPLGEVPREGTIACEFDRLSLLPGRYSMNVNLLVGGEMADYVQDAAQFDVGDGDYYGSGRLPPGGHGYALIDQAWTVVGEPPDSSTTGAAALAAR